jgi:hypothetical protein
MDGLTRRLRELMRIANRLSIDVEADATEEENVSKHVGERAQAPARRFLSRDSEVNPQPGTEDN